jgi:glutathione reductase (NADPH)
VTTYQFDLFTIGAGSGGVRASRIAASLGAKVAVAENRALGGTCVNVGCIPKKLLVLASHFAEDFEDAEGYGWAVGPRRFEWSRLIANKNVEIARLNGVYDRLLTDAGARIVRGRARLLDAHTIAVGDDRLTARHVLIATGGWPVVPPFPGAEHVITSNEVFFLEQMPERVVIVGGGYIAVEFAGILDGLGAQVTQLYRGPLFLRGFDDDIRRTLAEEMRKKGIDLRFRADVARIDRTSGGLQVTLEDGTLLRTDAVLYATGRAPLTRDLGLEEAGVRLNEKGAVIVDPYSQSSVDTIYAVGDCTDRINLTPVAIREGHAVAETLFAGRPTRADHTNVPTAVFTQPPIGTVGLTEAAARAAFGAIDVYRTSFRPLKHTLTGRDEQTMMKLIVERASDRVLGCHMVGADAPEIIQGLAVAVKAGARKADFDGTVGIHPTAAEEFVTLREKVPDPEPAAA